MGEIQNPRHERFAQELAAGNTADAALTRRPATGNIAGMRLD